ncbi:aminotransferase class I/II-fold pyridoxal phosphate-dependent enzyme [Catenulispora rubra]|uniref:aminotransferase class I/II-fold pyridoxal phosphate-dependent enzyme n=1 Tax=Catenulispora rubra TaxID=280293 RepID=UPI0018924F84|nr:aminotransferase class I/II-fold pyridoxal phosphate-dependent enzyme [Catenulispora rubra]
MIDLTGPPRPWSPRLAQRFAHCQQEALRTPEWWRGPAPFGEPELRDRLAELFGAPPERTVVTGGVRQFATVWAVVAPASVPEAGRAPMVVEVPTFADVPEIMGAAISVEARAWSNLGAVPQIVPLWLTNPFRNPDGRSLGPEQISVLADRIAAGVPVVINEVYRWYGRPGPVPEGAWIVTSLAKLVGPGVRLGWFVAPDAASIARPLTSDGPPTAWQRCWARFLDAHTINALRSDIVEATLDAKRAFLQQLTGTPEWQGNSPHLTVAHSTMDEPTALRRLADAGVRASPGAAFRTPIAALRLAFSGVTVAEAAEAARVFAKVGGFSPVLFD